VHSTQPGQLNVYSFRNQNTDTIQNVKLFEADELRAYLVVMPPGSTIETHVHANTNELFDVVEGEGQFTVDGRTFRGGSGKCVFIPAGVSHSIHNDSDSLWTLRVTYQECIYPRNIGKIVRRTIRKKLV
jgi:mannose-6-phosphate isomerase-like protein (cupin superfamily)